ncbi:SpoIIIAH-like family protein [Paenibacillus sp. MMS20-IR301]|uniref:SpoIIIAH-like family protein n=1 Tax=Paenibacillus sp. MMS20-IR301 TaxID=2895946 RepID=UPI0028ED5CF1|nr:SpoIIIAH-like family protein [Paenibacillus sp. MMS20-IR301]WNS44343.1 SpoIIIAH-like family protein [Paenibacillus sp. MMS20-IR301]
MKGKRQTIWLVSMLSLMVVLSAYYLFTEDTGSSIPKETAGSIQVDTVKDGTGGGTATALDSGLVINEVSTDGTVAADTGITADDSSTAAVTDETGKAATDETAAAVSEDSTDAAVTADSGDTAKDTAAAGNSGKEASADKGKETKAAAASTDKTPVKDDAAILDEVASQSVSATSMFTNYLYEREQKNLKDHNDLLALINDMDKSPSESAVAQEQLSKLEEKESKITGIEEQLQQKYGEAIVKEEAGDAYTIVVLSDKLDVKQAVGIVDLVMKELSVTQDKIKVQYVSEQ